MQPRIKLIDMDVIEAEQQQPVRLDPERFLRNPQLLVDLFRKLKVTPKHPLCPLPTAAQLTALLRKPDGERELVDSLEKRELLIRLMDPVRGDPYHYGFEPQQWRDADELLRGKEDIAVFGANGSLKSDWAAKTAVKVLVGKERAIVWCLCQSNPNSIRGDGQQERVWKYLPPDWKRLNHKRGTGISYTEKNRFSENSLVGPNGSECRFMNYEQDLKVIEGGQIDLWWADELVPVEFVTTLRGRTVDRKGKGIVTFTPIYGFTETVGDYVEGGRVTHWAQCRLYRDQQLWPGGELGMVPYVVESIVRSRGAIFFQSSGNPYQDAGLLAQRWEQASRDTYLARVHGLARRRIGKRFNFHQGHIVPADTIPKAGTRYLYIDFAWDRNWSMVWFIVTRINGKRKIYAYRDWPDKKTYGEWVVRSSAKKDGERGPAQASLNYGTTTYRQLIRVLEGNAPVGLESKADATTAEMIYERRGDPRSGALQQATEEDGNTSILVLLGTDGKDGDPGMDVFPINFTDGAGVIEHGCNVMNELLDYNAERPKTWENEPALVVSDACEQVIDCLNLWTGGDGLKGASKDFVDLVRYACIEEIDQVDAMGLGAQGRSGAY